MSEEFKQESQFANFEQAGLSKMQRSQGIPHRTGSHLTEEELITFLYCSDLAGSVVSAAPHVSGCPACQERLASFREHRLLVESTQQPGADISVEALAAQRRRIYASLSKPVSPWTKLLMPRWVPAGAALMLLGGGLFVFQHQPSARPEDKISDVQLAQEVSQLSQSAEAVPADPLKGLFE